MGREELLAFLDRNGIAVTTHDHAPLRTVEESRALRGAIAGAHTKNLFLKDKKGAIFLVVAEEESVVDLKQLHRPLGAASRLSFADTDTMRALLGVSPGAVTAFGVVNDTEHRVRLVLDRRLAEHDMVNCHPLTNTATTTIAFDDLLRFFTLTGHAPLMLALSGDGGEALQTRDH